MYIYLCRFLILLTYYDKLYVDSQKQNFWLTKTSFYPLLRTSFRCDGNLRCCDFYSNYGLCCALPFGLATLMLGVPNKTLSQIWLSWNLPIFLLRVGLFTLMKMDSLINLVMSCPSLPIILKLSWLSWCPVRLLCTWMGEGSLRCSLYLSPRVLDVSLMYSSPQSMATHW